MRETFAFLDGSRRVRATLAATVTLLVALAIIGWPAAHAIDQSVAAAPTTLSTGSNPDFDAVTLIPLTCNAAGDPPGDESPGSTDLVGDANHPAAYYAWDTAYLYARFRVNTLPTGPKGFDQYSWVMLLQVPSGDAFQYQYELSMNGGGGDDDFGNTGGQKGDTIEIWRNAAAENVDFTPLFNDPAETRLFAQRYDYSGPLTANTTPLARIVATNDNWSFGGDPDYFIDFAVPMSVLIAKGVITDAAQLSESLYFPASSANSNQYNKDHLDCPFLPYTTLSIQKTVDPTTAPASAPTTIVHTITVRNDGPATAKGVVITDTAFPAALSNITVDVVPSDPSLTWTVVTTNPLLVKLTRLPQGRSVTVTIHSQAAFTCQSSSFTNTATASATNALEVTAQATLHVGSGGEEICDGKDNDCDGQIDEGATLCDDGNACNGQEACVAGACTTGTPLTCASNNACIDDSCDPATGCVHTNRQDGTGCNDGNACTQADTCQAGACVGSNPVVCTASDPCHLAGTCNPATGACSDPKQPNDTSCDDGNACTQTDTCQAGACVGSNPVVCTASDQCHLVGTCDTTTGLCSNPSKEDGSPCSDGDLCSRSDTCHSGVCTGSNFAACFASDQCHLAGACDPQTGACSNPAKEDGTGCNDGNACTQSDTCLAGACVGSDPVTCSASDQCHVAGACDTATGACSNPTKPNGTSCDDGNACTRTDTCQAGACTGANSVTCPAVDQCHIAGTCDTQTGACSTPSKADGAPCSDGNACTQTDTCQAGTCAGANPVACTAMDQCHIAGTCDTTTGVCSNPTRDDGAPCSDGNACTQSDTCQSGACVGSNPVSCTASDQCHRAGTCDTSTGVCSNPAKTNGTACNDGNACTQTDTCQSGACVGDDPVTCTATDQCHLAGVCNTTTGLCTNPEKENGAPCNDGDACTQTDTCQAGACTGDNPVNCTAIDQCHMGGKCNPATGLCSNPEKGNGSPCDDNNACTQTDACQSGTCVGGNPVTCSAKDQCHLAGVCNTSTGVCSNPNKPNGSTCDDSNACTRSDTCQSGSCTGSNPVACTASDQCHTAGVCDPANGQCSNPSKPSGASCSDGNACTANDTCQSGVCLPGGPTNCNDANVCTNDDCDPAKGCVHTANDSPCNDGSACTSGDTCSNGTCVGGPPTWPDCESPHTQGFYKRLCEGPHPEDELTPANVECVNDWSRFESVATVADICVYMFPEPEYDKCKQADAQFMAAVLNLCKHRLALFQPIKSSCTDHTTVGESLNDANDRLRNARNDDSCTIAQCESDELNTGAAIGVIVLYANRTVNGIHVLWLPPPSGSGSTTTGSYTLWRKVRGVGSFLPIATVSGIEYDDRSVLPDVNYEYKVTAN